MLIGFGACFFFSTLDVAIFNQKINYLIEFIIWKKF